MKIKYYDFAEAEISDDRIKGILEPQLIEGYDRMQFEKELTKLLEECLPQKLQGVKKLLILVDDITRQTPVAWILPKVLEIANQHGLKCNDITLLVATGTHRAISYSEQCRKYGKDVVDRIKVRFHDYKRDVVDLGKTSSGTPVTVNKLVIEHDMTIGIGMVVPHRVAGFSGGGKIVQPGISGERTTGWTHWLSAQFEGREILGKIDNPVRNEIEEIAKIAGLSFIINVVLDRKGKPIKTFAGDPLPTFKKAATFSRKIYGVKAEKSEIVITDSYPADIEMWQAAKGVYSADLVLKRDGVLILCSPCIEGVGAEFGDLIVRFGYRGYNDVKKLVESGKLDNLIVAAHLVHVGRVIKDKGTGVLVSPGIEPEIAKKIGFIPAKDLKEAVEIAESIAGKKDITVCYNGGEILPIPCPTSG